MKASEVLELHFNGVSDKQKFSAAELLADIKGTYRRDEHHCYTGDNAGQA